MNAFVAIAFALGIIVVAIFTGLLIASTDPRAVIRRAIRGCPDARYYMFKQFGIPRTCWDNKEECKRELRRAGIMQ